MMTEPNRSYCTYPRSFHSYRWYKPLLTLLLSAVLTIAVIIAVMVPMYLFGFTGGSFAESYDDLDVYTAPGVIFSLGLIALYLPILWASAKLRRDRPFSSYSSVRGGWDFRLFFRCLGLAALTVALLNVALVLLSGEPTLGVRFTLPGLALCLVMGPLQCIAEEYFFRGILMQTLGAWVRIPALAVALSAAIFASQHPYDAVGVAVIFLSGLFFGAMAQLTGGLEASSAAHIANNMSAFLIAGVGYDVIHTATDPADLIWTLLGYGSYLALLLVGRKRGWFDHVRHDDAAAYNAWYDERLARKQAKKQAAE